MDMDNSNNIQTPYNYEEGGNEEEDELDLDVMDGAPSSLRQDDSFLMEFCPHYSSISKTIHASSVSDIPPITKTTTKTTTNLAYQLSPSPGRQINLNTPLHLPPAQLLR